MSALQRQRWFARASLVGAGLVGAAGGGFGSGCDQFAMPGLGDSRSTPAVAASTTTYSTTDIETAVVPGVAGEPDMRVRLRDSGTTARVGVTPGDTVWVMPADASRPPAALRSPVTVGLDAAVWTLTDAAGLTARYPRTAEVELAPERDMLSNGTRGVSTVSGNLARAATSSGLAPKITLDGGKFGGKLRLQARTDVSVRSFDVIEQVGVEEYLKGVVTAEMFPNWPLQAFCTQAVCARSYALHQRANARSMGQKFDVESSVKDQAYKGAVDKGPAADAVEATSGVILTWNGQVLRAYYSSTSGGRPGSARDTWPITRGYEYNLAGPIQAAPTGSNGARDATLGSTSPYYRWQAARSKNEAVSRLKEWGRVNGHPVKELAGLTGVTLTESNTAGRPTKFTVSGGGRTFALSAEQLRFALNQEAKGLPAIVKATRVNSGDMEVTIVGDVVNIKGRGFGHGVGMCQYSVKELADRGEQWRQIVPLFYPGAKLAKAY